MGRSVIPYLFIWNSGHGVGSLSVSGSLESRIGTLSLEQQEKLEKDAVKAEKKADKKAEAEQKKKEVSATRGDHRRRIYPGLKLMM